MDRQVDVEDWGMPGEIHGTRKHTSGANPLGVPGLPGCQIGETAWFAKGVPDGLTRADVVVPACCIPPGPPAICGAPLEPLHVVIQYVGVVLFPCWLPLSLDLHFSMSLGRWIGSVEYVGCGFVIALVWWYEEVTPTHFHTHLEVTLSGACIKHGVDDRDYFCEPGEPYSNVFSTFSHFELFGCGTLAPNPFDHLEFGVQGDLPP